MSERLSPQALVFLRDHTDFRRHVEEAAWHLRGTQAHKDHRRWARECVRKAAEVYR